MTQNPGEWGGPIHPQAFGAILRDTRLALGRSLEDVERQTRILVRHLTALEAGEFDRLPAGIYARGFVHNYSVYLWLNPQEMVRLFIESRGEVDTYYRPQPVARPVSTAGPIAPNFVVIVFVVGMLAVVTAWGYTLLVQPPKTSSLIVEATQANATPTTIIGRTITPVQTGSTGIPIGNVGTGTTAGAGTALSSTAIAASTTPAPTSVTVTLTASSLSYVDVIIDGQPFKTNYPMKAGETLSPPAGKSIRIKSAKPSVVTYTVDGKEMGPLPNEAYVVKYPMGIEITPGAANAPAASPIGTPKTAATTQPRG